MTIQVNSTCTSIAIASNNFNASNRSNTLLVSVNGGEATSITLAANATSYTLLPAALGVTSFEEGVYSIKLTSVLSNNSTTDDQGCTAVICQLKCANTTTAWYLDSSQESLLKVLALEGLISASGCVSCGCDLLNSF